MFTQDAESPSIPVITPAEKELTFTSETLESITKEAKHQQHPFGKVWQRFDSDAFTELVSNIQSRGLDQDILLYQDMILEGWHRYLACLLTGTEPRFTEFKGTDLEAAEKVHASGVRRQSSADQRYAAFVLLGDACPEFGAKYEKLKQQGIEQKNAGTPLSTDKQRVDVLGAKAAAAGVGRSTAVKVEKVRKRNPEAVIEIAEGKTTANKEVKKIAETSSAKSELKKNEMPNPVEESEAKEKPKEDIDDFKSVQIGTVGLHVNTVSLVDPVRKFFEEFGLKSKASQSGKGTVFNFDATANDQQNLLEKLAELVGTHGPLELRIVLE